MRSGVFLLSCLILIGLVGCGSSQNDSGSNGSSPVTSIENKGSDTMVNLALAWAERYQEIHP
jgi:phosphate transport system substrate-binding protein